jgi:hypothetical protein
MKLHKLKKKEKNKSGKREKQRAIKNQIEKGEKAIRR